MPNQGKIILNGSSTKTDELLQINDNDIKTIDTRGMACPYPSFESVKAMYTMGTSTCVDVITDSEESALKSIPSVCEKRGWKFIVLEDSQDLWRVRINR